MKALHVAVTTCTHAAGTGPSCRERELKHTLRCDMSALANMLEDGACVRPVCTWSCLDNVHMPQAAELVLVGLLRHVLEELCHLHS